MLRIIVSLIGILLCFVFQTSVFSELGFSGTVPDILLILVVSAGYAKGQKSGMFIGFFSGLVMDLYFSDYVGILAGIYVLVGFLAGFTNKIYDKEDFFLPILTVGIGELLFSVI
nr:rod shape-determining protein MreD [Lachnospiraceae bacterium]